MDLVDPLAEPCAVCGDKSTGTHYGVVSCNGCKGFFRRTILRNQKFTCRFNKKCVIDKNFRCACRYCRFQKCVQVGMKREAIQFERDAIGSPKKPRKESPPPQSHAQQPSSHVSPPDPIKMSVIDALMDMEHRCTLEMCSRYRSSVITTSTAGDGSSSAFSQPTRPCTVDELNEISRTTLLLMVEWAKNLHPFPELSMEDKIILLKNYAPQHLILMPAFRSPDTTRVCLFNNTYMSREQQGSSNDLGGFAAFKTSNITPRVLDEIVWPMRQLNMKEEEFVCLKALAFLHPEAKGLSSQTQTLIREARNKVLKALYAYILQNSPEEAPTRYGNILLLAPALKALTQLLIENMTLTKFFGLAEVDSLLSEFILDDINDQNQPASSSSVNLKATLQGAPLSVDSLSGVSSNPASQQPASNHSMGQQVNSPADSMNMHTPMSSASIASPSTSVLASSSHQVLSSQAFSDHSSMNLAHQMGVLNPGALLQPNTVSALLSQHNLLLPSTLSSLSSSGAASSLMNLHGMGAGSMAVTTAAGQLPVSMAHLQDLQMLAQMETKVATSL